MLDNPLISVIMPVYNGGKFIRSAIDSVCNQTYFNWELLIIDDGSNDDSLVIAKSYKDSRIKVFSQTNQGVSSARNVGLSKMKGDYFCFLDSDDVMPKKSLEVRVNKFKANPHLSFVDGPVEKKDAQLKDTVSIWNPTFRGNPFDKLIQLSDSCFLGLTWMIKTDIHYAYEMNQNLSHAEDLLFLIQICRFGGEYDFANETILIYRQHPNSAMNNLDKLAESYRDLYKSLVDIPEINLESLSRFKKRVKRILFLSFLRAGRPFTAIKSLL